MATLGPYDYSSPSTRFYMDYSVSQSQSGNYSDVNLTIRAYNGPSGSSSSSFSGAGTQLGQVDGVAVGPNHSATPFLPSGYAQNQLRWSESKAVRVAHDSAGKHANVIVRLHIAYGSINQDFTASVALPTIPKKPSTPAKPTVTNPATTSLQVNWVAPANGGSAITGYEVDYSLSSTFASGVTTVNDSASPLVVSGLNPGTAYYFRVRAKNAVGESASSATATGTTLPSVPPGLTIATSASGTAATLTFTPPGGVTGVTKYEWERRVQGTTTPVATGSTTTTVATVNGLTPGTTYEWRATAWIGSYESPATAWIPLKQAKPNTNPGDYFDGNTPDVADLNYQWGTDGTGAANNSISTAAASGVEGWQVAMTTGAGILYRVTAGEFKDYAARVVITRDTTGDSNRMGQRGATGYWTEVTEDVTYVGSIHVFLPRSQNMAAEISWWTAAGVFISRTPGTPALVPGGDWFRLAVGEVAPPTAGFAAVRAVDVNGAGWSPWLGGEIIDLDGAMISLNEEFPYFDGDTLFDGDYVYEWTGEANRSTSTRTPLDQVDPDSVVVFSDGQAVAVGRALIDPDCTPVPAPPRPPSIPSDCITDIGVWRRYYAVIPSNLVADWYDVVPTLEITSGAKAARQVRIRYYANPDDLPPNQVNTSSWFSEQIISFMPAHTLLTLDGVTQRVWAEVGTGNPISADHLLYGTNGKPATWPILSCGISYLVSIEVPIAEPAGNIEVEAFLTARS